MQSKGNFHLVYTNNRGITDTLVCGPRQDSVLNKLKELNAQATIENPFTIQRIFYMTLNGTIQPHKLRQTKSGVLTIDRVMS